MRSRHQGCPVLFLSKWPRRPQRRQLHRDPKRPRRPCGSTACSRHWSRHPLRQPSSLVRPFSREPCRDPGLCSRDLRCRPGTRVCDSARKRERNCRPKCRARNPTEPSHCRSSSIPPVSSHHPPGSPRRQPRRSRAPLQSQLRRQQTWKRSPPTLRVQSACPLRIDARSECCRTRSPETARGKCRSARAPRTSKAGCPSDRTCGRRPPWPGRCSCHRRSGGIRRRWCGTCRRGDARTTSAPGSGPSGPEPPRCQRSRRAHGRAASSPRAVPPRQWRIGPPPSGAPRASRPPRCASPLRRRRASRRPPSRRRPPWRALRRSVQPACAPPGRAGRASGGRRGGPSAGGSPCCRS
mmetsp:Transcript_94507/g.246129  ORF Transcript_94507/g.246129 Transcript_94507/m.246129 type:complete len:352 (-) Transcript_94507:148-1203(-)